MEEKNITESVKVDAAVMAKIRAVVRQTKQTIGGFISIEMNKVVDRKLKTQK